MSCFLIRMFQTIERSDRRNDPRGGVAILSWLTGNILTEEIDSDDFDFAAAAVIQLSGDSALLVILVYLPYPSPYEVSFEIGTNDIGDHYPTVLTFVNVAQPNASRMVISFTSCGEVKFFEKLWIHSTFEPFSSRAIVVDFYNYLWCSIEIKLLANPHLLHSNTMHTLNKLNAAKRKTVKNSSKANIESVEKLQVGLVNQRNWTECYSLLELPRKVCLTVSVSYRAPRQLHTQIHNDDCLKTVPRIANAFIINFSSNFNHAETPAIVYNSDDSVKLDDIFQSLNPSIIREKIFDMKKSPIMTNDFLPPKVLKLCHDVFATHLHPVFFSIIL